MTSFFNIDNLRTVTGGTYLSRGKPGATERIAEGVCTDSRSLLAGQVFLALAGERFDGHSYAAEVASAGAAAIIVQRELPDVASLGVPVIKVESTRKALLRLGAAYRRTLKETKVIAVCGSNGKSTTVRLIEQVLGSKLRGSASKKSHNNDIGVPLTILAAKPSDQFLICEVGTNHPGEIAQLGSIVEPDIAVITSIGREHLEFFGDLRGVAREEAGILPCIRPGGLAVLTADAPELTDYLKQAPGLITFGFSKEAMLRITAFRHELGPSGAPFAHFVCNDRLELTLPLVGRHNASNALAAIAVGRRLGLEDVAIAEALSTARGPEMRWQSETMTLGHGKATIINDAYNANPDSLEAAISTFSDLYAQAAGPWGLRRRIVVLADMLELGERSDEAHRSAGQLLAASGCVDVLVTIGPKAALAAQIVGQAWGVGVPGLASRGDRAMDVQADHPRLIQHAEPSDDATKAVARLVQPGDVVLLKGSRGMRLERIARDLKALASQSGVSPIVATSTTNRTPAAL